MSNTLSVLGDIKVVEIGTMVTAPAGRDAPRSTWRRRHQDRKPHGRRPVPQAQRGISIARILLPIPKQEKHSA